jgi:hypothetical protein
MSREIYIFHGDGDHDRLGRERFPDWEKSREKDEFCEGVLHNVLPWPASPHFPSPQ